MGKNLSVVVAGLFLSSVSFAGQSSCGGLGLEGSGVGGGGALTVIDGATGDGGGFWLASGSSGSGTPPAAMNGSIGGTPSALRGGSLGGGGARLCTRAESIPIVGPSLTAQVVPTLIAVFSMQYCSHADVSEETEH